jgi:hypothetical protein
MQWTVQSEAGLRYLPRGSETAIAKVKVVLIRSMYVELWETYIVARISTNQNQIAKLNKCPKYLPKLLA